MQHLDGEVIVRLLLMGRQVEGPVVPHIALWEEGDRDARTEVAEALQRTDCRCEARVGGLVLMVPPMDGSGGLGELLPDAAGR